MSVAAAVVDPEGRVLAIRRRDNDHWEPPGGVLELDETIDAGLVREVREETGLTVEVGPLTGVSKNMRRGIVAFVFRCAPVDGAAGVSAEAREIRWLDPDEIATQMDEAYVRMLDALAGGGPFIRAHGGVALLDE